MVAFLFIQIITPYMWLSVLRVFPQLASVALHEFIYYITHYWLDNSSELSAISTGMCGGDKVIQETVT